MPESDRIRLLHMLEAAREAVAFLAGKNREHLLSDRLLALALVKCIEIIGEAAAKIGPEVRAQYADIPWADIVGMRNRLIHAYFDIDLGLLYETVTGDLPPLIQKLEQIMSAAD